MSRIAAPMLIRPGCIMADWSRAFDDPIPLPRGRQLVNLKDAANYIQKLSQATSREPLHSLISLVLANRSACAIASASSAQISGSQSKNASRARR